MPKLCPAVISLALYAPKTKHTVVYRATIIAAKDKTNITFFYGTQFADVPWIVVGY